MRTETTLWRDLNGRAEDGWVWFKCFVCDTKSVKPRKGERVLCWECHDIVLTREEL